MNRVKQTSLVLEALCALVRYDVVLRLRGSAALLRSLKAQRVARQTASHDAEQTICEAVLLASCLYWKPVLCLQRSVSTVQLLRKHGIDARMVIGFRPLPFFSHAWVEVAGRVVYGSSAYQSRLQPLYVA